MRKKIADLRNGCPLCGGRRLVDDHPVHQMTRHPGGVGTLVTYEVERCTECDHRWATQMSHKNVRTAG